MQNIVDESLLIKNPSAYRTEHINQIRELCKYVIILNGTPVSRNEADLFAQFYLLDWRILGYQSYWSFAANHLEYDDYGKIRRVLNKDYLTDKIAPYSVQISKRECLSLPKKVQKTAYFDLTENQNIHYDYVKWDFLSLEALYAYDTSVIYRTFNALQQVASGRHIMSSADKPIKHRAMFDNLIDNPRLQTLLKVLKNCNNDKVIIWCKFMHEINDIATLLEARGISYVCFHGKISQKKRQEALRKFANDTQILIANKICAGFGLNLQFCHVCIYYNNDWNWATRAQSEDRLYRIGQNQNIDIWDICANCTIDERIMTCLYRKENMVDTFKKYLKNKNFSDWLDGKEIDDLNDNNRID